MASTINAVNISIRADTTLARNEIKDLTGIIRKTQDPAIALDRSVRLLDKALADGAISAKQHSRAIDELQKSYDKSDASASKLTTGLGKLATAAALVGAARVAVNSFTTSMERVDRLADVSKGLGTNINSLRAFGSALSEIAGVSFEESVQSLKGLQTEVGLAAQGLGKNQKIFKSLGLDPKELANLDPTEQFQKVIAEIGNMESAAERAAIAQKLFGDSMLATAAANQAQELKKVNEELKAFYFPINEQQVESVGKLNDQLGRTSAWFSGMWDRFWAEVADGIYASSENVSAMNKGLEKQVALTKEIDPNAKKIKDAFDEQYKSVMKQLNILDMGEQAYRDFEREQMGFSQEQIDLLNSREKLLDLMKEQAKVAEENKRIEAENAQIALRRLKIEEEGAIEIAKIAAENDRKAAASMSGPAFAPLVQAETKQAFDFEVKRQQDNSKILEDQRELQRRIAAASEDTAKKIANLKPMRAAR